MTPRRSFLARLFAAAVGLFVPASRAVAAEPSFENQLDAFLQSEYERLVHDLAAGRELDAEYVAATVASAKKTFAQLQADCDACDAKANVFDNACPRKPMRGNSWQ